MKSLLLVTSLVLSAVSAASSFAQESLTASPEALVLLSSQAHARVGMSREDLVDQLGEPAEKLSASVWVYTDFRAKDRPVSEQANALVVVFEKDKVTRLRLTDNAAMKTVIAKVRANAHKDAKVARK
jgi:outer membrane protein assembly factor BamE (lipoprotein component of BamABCDE complex)